MQVYDIQEPFADRVSLLQSKELFIARMTREDQLHAANLSSIYRATAKSSRCFIELDHSLLGREGVLPVLREAFANGLHGLILQYQLSSEGIYDYRGAEEIFAGDLLLLEKIAHDQSRLPEDRDICIAIDLDRKSTRLNSSHTDISRMPSSA